MRRLVPQNRRGKLLEFGKGGYFPVYDFVIKKGKQLKLGYSFIVF
jgi:hypothetical protein